MKHFAKILPNVCRIHNIWYNQMFTTAIYLLVNFGIKKYMFRLYIKYSEKGDVQKIIAPCGGVVNNNTPMWSFAFKTHLINQSPDWVTTAVQTIGFFNNTST